MTRGWIAAVALALVTGCQAPAPSPSVIPDRTPLAQAALNDAKVGVRYPFEIVTEYCLLWGAIINGDWWIEKGALESGKWPEEGYDMPVDSGTIQLLNRHTARYVSEVGMRFMLIRTPEARLHELQRKKLRSPCNDVPISRPS